MGVSTRSMKDWTIAEAQFAGRTALGPQDGADPGAPVLAVLREQARERLRLAVENLLAQQMPGGFWCAELEGDSILESEYILLKWIIEQETDPRLPGSPTTCAACNSPTGSGCSTPARRRT